LAEELSSDSDDEKKLKNKIKKTEDTQINKKETTKNKAKKNIPGYKGKNKTQQNSK